MSPVLVRLEDETAFSAATAVPEPVGQPLAHTRTALHQPLPGTDCVTGVWECSPGKFRRKVVEAEYSYIVSGEGSFAPDNGEVIEFRPGDALYFASHTQGTWDIRQTVRKTYFILK